MNTRALRRCLLLSVVGLVALAVSLLGSTSVASANRFGPPWMAVVPEGAVVYSGPSLDSPPVGPLSKNDRLPVLSEVKGDPGPDGDTTWYGTELGFLPSAVVIEDRQPWVAEVVRNGVAVYAKPDHKSAVRRQASTGSLLRVTGLSPGLDGDTNVWWATTEGYVGLDTLRPATGEVATEWVVPDGAEALAGWWGAVAAGGGNARAAASTRAAVVGVLAGGQRVKVLGEEAGEAVSGSDTWYRIDGGRFAGARVHSSLIRRIAQPTPSVAPPETVPEDQTWVTVDRKTSTLTFIQAGKPIFATYVSLGRAGVNTPSGLYSTFGKYKFDDMTSASVEDADRTYDLPNVPFTQYYRLGGFAIHGTYWHDEFGSAQSQGCVNLTVSDAAYLFGLTKPAVAPEDNARWSAAEAATPVVILD